MIIKNWNNHDMGVYKIHPNMKKVAKQIHEKLKKDKKNEEFIKNLKKISREFWEDLGLEFVHNLKPGWENKLLNNGRVLLRDGGQELKTKKEIQAEMSKNGQVQFHHRQKNNSLNFIAREVKKPAHLCWS